MLRFVLAEHIYEPVAGTSIQLLWFLGAYVLVLAAVPMLYRITTTGRLAVGVVTVYAFVVTIDVLRLNVDAFRVLGYLNVVVWLIPGMFGVAYRRGPLCRRAAIALAALMFVIDMLLVRFGPYELSLVDGGHVAGPGARSAAVGTALCIAGTATLVSVRWGLKDDGLICIAVLLVALVAARALAADAKVPATVTS